jgi:hypothetical protein
MNISVKQGWDDGLPLFAHGNYLKGIQCGSESLNMDSVMLPLVHFLGVYWDAIPSKGNW